jgi:hypothetical protein
VLLIWHYSVVVVVLLFGCVGLLLCQSAVMYADCYIILLLCSSGYCNRVAVTICCCTVVVVPLHLYPCHVVPSVFMSFYCCAIGKIVQTILEIVFKV